MSLNAKKRKRPFGNDTQNCKRKYTDHDQNNSTKSNKRKAHKTTIVEKIVASKKPAGANKRKKNLLNDVDSNWKKLLVTGRIRISYAKRHAKIQGSLPKEAAKPKIAPAALYGKIYSRDKELTKVLAIDCEMVGVGISMQSRLAKVCVINYHGHVLLEKHCRPKERITDFRTKWSGVRAIDLINAPSIEVVQQEVADLLRGNIVVGHALKHDFEALLVQHKPSLIRDTSAYRPLKKRIRGKLRQRKLRELAMEELEWKIQDGEHDPYIDARAALEIYKKHEKEWEKMLSKRREKRQQSRLSLKRKKRKEELNTHLLPRNDVFSKKRFLGDNSS